MGRAFALGHDATSALAQAMRLTAVRQSGCSHLLAEPSVEALLAKRAAPLVGEERQRFGRTRAGFDGGDKRCGQRHLDLHRLALAVLLLGEDQPSILHMLAAERDAVPPAEGDTEEEFEREPGLGATRVVSSTRPPAWCGCEVAACVESG